MKEPYKALQVKLSEYQFDLLHIYVSPDRTKLINWVKDLIKDLQKTIEGIESGKT